MKRKRRLCISGRLCFSLRICAVLSQFVKNFQKKCPFFTQLCGLGGVFWDKTWVKSKNFGAKNHSIKNIRKNIDKFEQKCANKAQNLFLKALFFVIFLKIMARFLHIYLRKRKTFKYKLLLGGNSMKNALSIFSPSFEDDLLQHIGNGLGFLSPASHAVPSVDIKQTEAAYLLDMELPGFDEKDVEINLHEHLLTISSKHEAEKEDKKDDNGVQYLVKERSSRSFTRRFTLPEDTNCEAISAKFNKGVLEVTIPRNPETKPRTISIAS